MLRRLSYAFAALTALAAILSAFSVFTLASKPRGTVDTTTDDTKMPPYHIVTAREFVIPVASPRNWFTPRVRERNGRHTDTSKPDELYLYAGVLTQAGSIKLPHVSTRNTVDDDKIYLIRFAPFCHSKNVARFRDVLCVTPFFMTSERTLATEPNALLSVWGRGLFLSLVLLQTFNNNTQPIYGSGSHFLPRPGAVLSCASGRGVLLRGFLVV